jgi:hypothetical protein
MATGIAIIIIIITRNFYSALYNNTITVPGVQESAKKNDDLIETIFLEKKNITRIKYFIILIIIYFHL